MVWQFAYIHSVARILLLLRKKYKCGSTVFLSLKKLHQETLITKTTVSISCAQNSQWTTKQAKKFFSSTAWAYQPKPPLHGLNLIKSPIKNYAILFRVGSGHHSNQTQLDSTEPNKSPTWRLVQSPTSTAILQKQSLVLTTHPPSLKLEDQLKLHTASTSQ